MGTTSLLSGQPINKKENYWSCLSVMKLFVPTWISNLFDVRVASNTSEGWTERMKEKIALIRFKSDS